VSDLGSFASSTGVWDVLTQLVRLVLPAHIAAQAVTTYFWCLSVSAYFTNTEKVKNTNLLQTQECANNIVLELLLWNQVCSGSVLTVWA